MRWEKGIWPPSKPRRKPSLRAFWPFWPRPEVLPRPEPVPRPTRSGRRWAPFAGFRSCSCMALLVSPLVLLGRAGTPDLVLRALRALPRFAFDRNEERDTAKHPAHGFVVGQLTGLVHFVQTKRFD